MQFPEYLSCCRRVDWNVGRLLHELQQQGIADSTLVVYTSDHGCNFHTRGGSDKCTCHDSSVRVPLLVRGPGFESQAQEDVPVSLIDLAPTLLAAADLPVPAAMRGTDIRAAERPESVYIEILDPTRRCIERAVRTDSWTYCAGAPLESAPDTPFRDAFLYDLRDDPHQLTNLVASPAHADVRARLRNDLAEWMRTAGETRPLDH